MQYFFKKNSSKKENRRKKYIIFRITSHKDINDELILKISRIINADPCIDIFEKNLSYNAIFYRAGIKSPWSSKTKDIEGDPFTELGTSHTMGKHEFSGLIQKYHPSFINDNQGEEVVEDLQFGNPLRHDEASNPHPR